jgi:hypothetical protein
MTLTVPPLSNKNLGLVNTVIGQLAQGRTQANQAYIDPKRDFGAVGDGVTDDTVALQAAGNAAIAAKIPLYIPGTTNGFIVSQGPSGACLQFTAPIQIIGNPGLSIIRPSDSCACDIIRFVGSSNGYIRTVVSGIMIGNPNKGTRKGQSALVFLTLFPNQLFLRPIIRDCFLQDSGANSSIYVNNSAANNPNGGFAYGLIDNNILNQISLNQAGDSIRISHNNLYQNTNTGTASGIYANLVANAGNLQIVGNNGGINGACVWIDYADTFDVSGNEFEHNNNGGTDEIIKIWGHGARVPGGNVTNNELTVLQGSSSNHVECLKIDIADGIFIDGNKFATFTAYVPFEITSNAGSAQTQGCKVGGGNFFPTSSTLRLTDSGNFTEYVRSKILCGHTPHASTIATNTTAYVMNDISTSELQVYFRCPYANCIIKNLEIFFGNGAPGAGQSYTCTLMKNGGATAVTCTVSGNASNSAGDITHQASYAQGDQFSIQVVTSNGAAIAQDVQWTMELCQF